MKLNRDLLGLIALAVLLSLPCSSLLAEPAAYHRPVFLPGGHSFVVMRTTEDGDWELFLADLGGTLGRRLTWHDGWDGYAARSADGSRIVFDRSDEEYGGLYSMDLVTGEGDWLLRSDGPDVGGSAFAPDDQSIVFVSKSDDKRDIYRLWFKDGRREQITSSPLSEADPVFSPAGDTLAYSVRIDDELSALEVLDLASGTVRRILTLRGNAYGLAWGPKGSVLYFNADSDGDQELFQLTMGGEAAVQLTSNEEADHLPSVSPDGRSLLFTSQREGPEAVFVLDLESGQQRRLDLITQTEIDAPVTAFVNVRVLTMAGMSSIDDGVVLVRAGKILGVGPRSRLAIPPNAHLIDGQRGTLLPGLIDAHVHIRSANNLRFYLARGFTTVRDMNGNLSKTLEARELVDAGEILGARVVAASRTVLAEPFRNYPAPRTADEARAVATKAKDAGFDLIKVFRLGRVPFVALMEQARTLGIPVAGHVPNIGLDDPTTTVGIPFEVILESGMASLEHILEVAKAGTADLHDENELRRLAKRIAKAGVPVGTLAVSALNNNRLKLDRDSLLREKREQIVAMFGEEGLESARSIDTTSWEVVPEEVVHRVIRVFHRAGVQLILGTDSHSPSILAGQAGLDELELLVAAGLSPRAALETATVSAADALGLGSELGTIEVGMRADLMLVSGDPTIDIGVLRNPLGVVAGGRWLDRKTLDLLSYAAVLHGGR